MTPGGVVKKVRLQRTIRQVAISHLRSRPVTAYLTAFRHPPSLSAHDPPRDSVHCGRIAIYLISSSRRAVRTARAAGEPACRQISRAKAEVTPAASHQGPNSQAAEARAK